ncbi:MAG: DUF2079 domain-containing protein, partial [Candidatus Omnitrophica bacterium]|nr:DUF2079 domain-containing protein [Candidatus Omnitrophota bacterium]
MIEKIRYKYIRFLINSILMLPISVIITLFFQSSEILRDKSFVFLQNMFCHYLLFTILGLSIWVFIWTRFLFFLGTNSNNEYHIAIRNEVLSLYIFSILGIHPILKTLLPCGYHTSTVLYYMGLILVTISFSLFIASKFRKVPLGTQAFEIRICGFAREIEINSKILNYLPPVLMLFFLLFFSYLNSFLIMKSQNVSHALVNIFNAIMKGDFLYTVNDLNRQLNIFGYYLAPIWLIIAPISYLFNHNLFMLFLIQGVVILLGAIPILKFAKERLGGNIYAVTFLLSYLFSFYIQTAHLWSVEVRTMSTTVMSWALYYLFTGNNKRFLSFIILFLLCGTSGAVAVAGI